MPDERGLVNTCHVCGVDLSSHPDAGERAMAHCGDHHWMTPCGEYALRLTAASWQQIDRECARSGNVETGGVLVGHYTADESTAIITEALEPPRDSARGRSWFHRGVAGLRGLLAKRWANERRTYYVGEWHYHPASIVEPSGDDLAQMYGINVDPRYRCREPIMVIIGQARDGGERPMRAFVFPQGKAHIELEPTDWDDLLNLALSRIWSRTRS